MALPIRKKDQHRNAIDDRGISFRERPAERVHVDPNISWDDVVKELELFRPGRREPFLEVLHSFLMADYIPEKVVDKRDSLFKLLRASLEKGAPKEAVLAMECIISIIITLGAHQLDEDEFEDLSRSIRVALVTIGNGELRRAACHAYGILAFFGSKNATQLEDAEEWFQATSLSIGVDTDAVDEYASGLFNCASASSEMAAADLQTAAELYIEGFLWGWGLLVTQWDTEVLAEWNTSPTEDLLDCLLRCISFANGNLSILTPACFLLAVLFEARWRKNKADVVRSNYKKDDRQVLAELEGRYKNVMDTVRHLAEYNRERRHSRSKDAWRTEKELFRMVLRTAETGEGPSESVCIGSRARTTTFKSWIALLRYKVFRKALKSATAAHLRENMSLMNAITFTASRRATADYGFENVAEYDLLLHSEAELRERNETHKFRHLDRTLQRHSKQALLRAAEQTET